MQHGLLEVQAAIQHTSYFDIKKELKVKRI